MNKIVENLLDRVSDWPEQAQRELVEAAAEIEARHFAVYPLTEEERAAVKEGLAQADRGEFVADEVVAAYFAKYRA